YGRTPQERYQRLQPGGSAETLALYPGVALCLVLFLLLRRLCGTGLLAAPLLHRQVWAGYRPGRDADRTVLPIGRSLSRFWWLALRPLGAAQRYVPFVFSLPVVPVIPVLPPDSIRCGGHAGPD